MRALIPLGFMPAADGSFSLMICPGGLPFGFLPEDKGGAMPGGMGLPMPQAPHGHGVTDYSYCIFTTGCSAAPPPLLLATILLLIAAVAAIVVAVSAPAGIRLVHVPEPRAPPAPV